jgi:hypothetical protein
MDRTEKLRLLKVAPNVLVHPGLAGIGEKLKPHADLEPQALQHLENGELIHVVLFDVVLFTDDDNVTWMHRLKCLFERYGPTRRPIIEPGFRADLSWSHKKYQ